MLASIQSHLWPQELGPIRSDLKGIGPQEGKEIQILGGQIAWVQIPDPAFTSCVTLGKLLNLSEPFLHLFDEANYSTYIIVFLRGMSKSLGGTECWLLSLVHCGHDYSNRLKDSGLHRQDHPGPLPRNAARSHCPSCCPFCGEPSVGAMPRSPSHSERRAGPPRAQGLPPARGHLGRLDVPAWLVSRCQGRRPS